MNIGCDGPLLLVGEGDFSLSLSLRKQLPEVCLYSSSLLREADVTTLHKNAQNNIRQLQAEGVTVLLGVDATRLHRCVDINEVQFSRIIFNFPHIGGKSNIKKNRELLLNFFKSAAAKLKADGDICITLCRGQTGIHVDKPRRLWSNTWQALAMAADANLVLVDTVEFFPQNFPEYNSTGYRSRDQFFHVAGGLTTIYKKVEPHNQPSDIIQSLTVEIDGHLYAGNSFLMEAIKTARKLIENKESLLGSVYKHLHHLLQNHFSKINCVELKQSLIRDVLDPTSERQTQYLVKKLSQQEENTVLHKCQACSLDPGMHKYILPCTNSQQMIRCSACKNTNVHNNQTICPVYDHKKCDQEQDNFVIRSSLLSSLDQSLPALEEDKIYFLLGDVYQKCAISSRCYPQHIDLLYLIKDDLLKLRNLCEYLFLELDIEIKIHTNSDDSFLVPARFQKTLEYMEREVVWITSDLPLDYPYSTPCNVDTSNEKTYSPINELTTDTERTVVLACIGQLKSDNTVYACHCAVDNICQSFYGIGDTRILWSSKLDLFNITCNAKREYGKDNPFKPFSLYAPAWIHDISFWENPVIEFDEQIYLDIVRDHTGNCIKDVFLMNKWTPEGESNTSRCYRHIYQSCDQAVSYHQAHEFQRLLRLKVAHVLNIQLR